MMREAVMIATDLLKRFEGFRARAYQDVVGVWTIGYGETLGVHEGMVWTEQYAAQRLSVRVAEFMGKVLKACPQLAKESPEKLAACTSLAYNIGVGAFRASSVCRLTKSGEYARAAAAFLYWNKAGGKVYRGLTIRRQLESKIYLSK